MADRDLLLAMYQKGVPVGVAAKQLSPEQMAQAYEGGGLQQPLIDPIDIAAGMGAARLMRGGARTIGKIGKDITERVATAGIDPTDPLGTTNYFLQKFSFNRVPMRTVAEHKALEIAAEKSPKAAKQLAEFESNAHRLSNLGKLWTAFEEVDTALPHKAAFYRKKLAELTTRLSESGAHGTGLGGEVKQTPVPTSLVKDWKKLLQMYKKDLISAGQTGPVDVSLYPGGSFEYSGAVPK